MERRFRKSISVLFLAGMASSACGEVIERDSPPFATETKSPETLVLPTNLPKETREPARIPSPTPTSSFQTPETNELDIVVEDIPFDPNQTIPVLEYHNPNYGINNGEYAPIYMTEDIYEEQLKTLKELEFYTPSEQELLGWLEGKHGLPQRSVIIRIDIGVPRKDYQLGFELLEKYDLRAILFILTGLIPETESREYVGWDTIEYWVEKGVLIPASHGVHHPNYQELTPANALWDSLTSKEEIEERLGRGIHFFAFPYDSEGHENLLLSHFKMLFGSYTRVALAGNPLVGTYFPYAKEEKFDMQTFRDYLVESTQN